eukprot:m.411658 g.411658  ORF g.411658 m.411658 type:complete len:61 (+) comp56555_c2_seq5:2175-2357(+)
MKSKKKNASPRANSLSFNLEREEPLSTFGQGSTTLDSQKQQRSLESIESKRLKFLGVREG